MNYSSPFENEARKDIRSTYYGIDRNELLESASSGGSDNDRISEASLSRAESRGRVARWLTSSDGALDGN